MISWHKPGQKVTLVDGVVSWTHVDGWRLNKSFPVDGEIYTIDKVRMCRDGKIRFILIELPGQAWGADAFRPVYPIEVENLRQLCVTPPTRVKEDA